MKMETIFVVVRSSKPWPRKYLDSYSIAFNKVRDKGNVPKPVPKLDDFSDMKLADQVCDWLNHIWNLSNRSEEDLYSTPSPV